MCVCVCVCVLITTYLVSSYCVSLRQRGSSLPRKRNFLLFTESIDYLLNSNRKKKSYHP